MTKSAETILCYGLGGTVNWKHGNPVKVPAQWSERRHTIADMRDVLSLYIEKAKAKAASTTVAEYTGPIPGAAEISGDLPSTLRDYLPANPYAAGNGSVVPRIRRCRRLCAAEAVSRRDCVGCRAVHGVRREVA